MVAQYFIYILLCENGAFYTGYTNDMARRYQEHLAGTSKAKYTRSFKPIKLVACWQVDDKGVAMQIERYIKKLSRLHKEQLVSQPVLLKKMFHEVEVLAQDV